MQEPAQTKQTAGYLKALGILFYAMLAGQLSFAVIVYILNTTGASNTMPPDEQRIFEYVAPTVLFLCIAANWSILKKRIEYIRQEPDLSVRLGAYRALYITRFALAEAPALFAIIFVFVTGSKLIWLVVLIALISFVTLRPGKERLIKELDLSSDEISKLEGIQKES